MVRHAFRPFTIRGGGPCNSDGSPLNPGTPHKKLTGVDESDFNTSLGGEFPQTGLGEINAAGTWERPKVKCGVPFSRVPVASFGHGSKPMVPFWGRGCIRSYVPQCPVTSFWGRVPLLKKTIEKSRYPYSNLLLEDLVKMTGKLPCDSTHFSLYYSGDWDVHWGYGLLTHGHFFVHPCNGAP